MLQATRRQVTPAAKVTTFSSGGVVDALSYVFFAVAVVVFAVIAVKAVTELRNKSAITNVVVEGDLRNIDRAQVIAAAKNAITGGFFNADLPAVHQAVKATAWVGDVTVSRVWPNGIRLQLRETQPVALWGNGGVLDARGEPFTPKSAISIENLPILSGPLVQSRYVMEQYRAMNSILRGIGMHIVELQLTDRMSWFIRLDSGVRIVVDQVDAIEKMQRFAYLFERQLKPDASNIASVDLRYRNGVAIGWKTVSVARG